MEKVELDGMTVTDGDGVSDNTVLTAESAKARQRRKWSKQKLDMMFSFFGQEFTNEIMPSGKQLADFVEKLFEPKRTVAQVCTQIYNYMTGKIKQFGN